MKLLFFKLIGFAFITTLVFILLFEIAFLFPDKTIHFLESKHKWLQVYQRVIKSNNVIKANTIVVGDSVGGQIFPYYKKDNYLTSNGSVYAAGNYILVYNALNVNPNIRKVILVSSPLIIGHEFERKRTCNNFIKPFFTIENLKHLSTDTLKKIAKKPISLLYLFYFFKCLPINEVDYTNNPYTKKQFILSDFSIEYLIKLKSLCADRNVKLSILSPPVNRKLKEKFTNWKEMRAQIKKTNLDAIFRVYFDNIEYLEDNCFKDQIHLSPAYLKVNRNRLANNILSIQ